ncbi:hypothetical protein LR48_Vigan08g067800 [Vigna angularis]|uniref:Uncharacterized protein n=1 Tax=Phaseolus angularis TaxID=3914 RepID=A0A0L9V4C4_PHAAN|nr:hypothetical protein LR48_Vigan08g067800 [Vigna angularis]
MGRNWRRLATYPAPANVALVKEFYTNARRLGDYPAEDYLSYVCANTMNNKAPLGHPSLITHMCKIAGVDTFAPPLERPRKSIDEAYYRWTMNEFHNVVAWPVENAQGSRVGAAEASAMEEDEDDDDDTFEDAEDNEEEEDTDDNTD